MVIRTKLHARGVLISAMLLLAPEGVVHADIYQFTDSNGVIHFSDVSAGTGKTYKRIITAPEKRPAAQAEPQPAISFPARAPIPASNASSAYSEMISSACDRHGVDPGLVHAMVKVESDFNPFAISSKGARGLMQLMPQTAVDLNVANTFNPSENIDGGVRYIKYLIERYEGNLSLALAAYNSGETAVKKWGTIPPYRETQNYVQKILKLYNGGHLVTPRYTIYMGYSEDGSLLLTDDPGKHAAKNMKRRSAKNL